MANFRESNTKWRFQKDLGSGAFGNVSLWINIETNDAVAIKRCHMNFKMLGLDEKQKQELRWKHECDLMNRVIDKHPNIVSACQDQCRDLIAEQNLKSYLKVIGMEYCDGGNLRQKLQQIDNVNGFSEHDVREVLKALSGAISHLHSFKLTHRDIKPDNIVIKLDANMKPIYKLTDMGYARLLDYKTINASMVGTMNYFAPEIAVTADYKNNVDYWSIGIVAFEIICGVLPFLQDHIMYEVLNNILKKSDKCIAITKNNDGRVIHHEKLFKNRLTVVFRSLIEPWLQLALEKDGKKRGYEAGHLTFYTKLERALNAKIITMFWINRCKFLSYFVDETMTMDVLLNEMEKTTGVGKQKYYFVFPPGHTLDSVPANVKPIQFYEEKFAAEDKPMLYLVDFESNSLCVPKENPISDYVRENLNLTKPLEPWVLKDTLLNVVHIHHNEQRKIREFVNGVQDYGLNLEQEIMNRQLYIKVVKEKVNYFEGQVAQYEMMVATGKQLLQEKQMSISTECVNITQNFEIQLRSVLEKTRVFLKKFSLNQHQENFDIPVKQFLEWFESQRHKSFSSVSVNDISSQTFRLLEERNKFFTKTRKSLEMSITSYHIEFLKMMDEIINHNQKRLEWQSKLEQKTRDYMKEFAQTYNSSSFRGPEDIVERMDVLYIENRNDFMKKAAQTCNASSSGGAEDIVEGMDIQTDNEPALAVISYNLDDSGVNEPTDRIINDAKNLMQMFKSTFLP